MGALIRLRSFGTCLLEVADRPIVPSADVSFALLLYLVLEHERPVARDRLVELLWPEEPAQVARHRLRQALYKLRTLGAPLHITPAGVRAGPSLDLDVDAVRLARTPAALAQAAAYVLGDWMPGYEPELPPPYVEWLHARRSVALADGRRVLIGALAQPRARGQWREVEDLARRCLSLDPLNEEATLALAEAAAMAGNATEAVRAIDAYLREVGARPGAAARARATALKRRIVSAEILPALGDAAAPALVGRAEQMEVLADALRRAAAGAGGARLITGAAGIGKSRLVAEFARHARLQHAHCVTVRCEAAAAWRPFAAVTDLVPRLLGLPGALGCDPAALRILRRLGEPLGGGPAAPSAPAEVALTESAVQRSVADLLAALGAEAPIICVVEDAQWLDAQSRQLCAALIDESPSQPVLWVLTARPCGETESLTRLCGSALLHMPLEGLSEADGERLLADIAPAPSEGDGGPRTAAYIAAAGGNPGFLTALATRFATPHDPADEPGSLRDLLRERLARLSRDALRTLQACAVWGGQATLRRLAETLPSHRVDLLGALEELERDALIEPSGAFVRCRHDAIAGAALATLTTLSRRALHRAVAEILERELGAPASVASVWNCADHWLHAGDVFHALTVVRLYGPSSDAEASVLTGPARAAHVFEAALRESLASERRAAGLRGEDRRVTKVPLSGRPYAVAVAPGGAVYVCQIDAASLARADLPDESFTAIIPVGYLPSQVRFHPDGSRAYVANQDARTVSIVDVATNRETAVIPVEGSVLALAVSPDGARVYATTDYEGVHVLDVRSKALVATVPAGPVLTGVALHPTAPLLYVAAREGGTVTAIDTRTNTVAATFHVPGKPQNLAVSRDGRELFGTDVARSVLYVWDLRTGALSAEVPIGSAVRRNVFDVAVTPDDAQLYVSAIHDGRVFVLDRTTRAVVRTIATGGLPRYIAFDRSGARAVIPNESGWVDFVS